MMKSNKNIIIALFIIVVLTCTSCTANEDPQKDIKPQVSQMKTISELAAMECYYHNVAKFKEETNSILPWKKDKHFWIEYSGIVKVGIDTSLLNLVVNDDIVTITIPDAKVLGKEVDEISLSQNSFIVDENSADINAEDEVQAFEKAQENMVTAAANDSVLLASAQQRVQKLLEEYVSNVGEAIGKDYSIQWIYVDENGSEIFESVKELPAADPIEDN